MSKRKKSRSSESRNGSGITGPKKRFYKIQLAPLITYTTDNLQAAVTIAHGIALDTGHCALEVRNESGGGYVSVYDGDGKVKERRGLNERNT
jgi:hypothetical protein